MAFWGDGSALRRGWSMARASFAVLRQYPKLVLFPALSGLALLLVGGLIGLSLFPQVEPLHRLAAPLWQRLGEDDAGQIIYYLVAFALVYVLTGIAVFCNVALTQCALRAHAGREPSLTDGFGAAASCLPQILGWALIAASVGVLLKLIEGFLSDKLGFLGSLIAGVFEFGWSVATYFVLPLVAAERAGPITALRRSSAIVRSKWGESVAGDIRLGLLGLLFGLLAALVFFAGLALAFSYGATALAALGVLLMALGVALGLLTIVVLQALTTIFQAGLYVYATTGNVPPSLDRALVERAFTPKT